MKNHHVRRLPVGTLVLHRGLQHSTYGIVIGHTMLNVIVILSEPYHGRKIIHTSDRKLKSIQRPYSKPKV